MTGRSRRANGIPPGPVGTVDAGAVPPPLAAGGGELLTDVEFAHAAKSPPRLTALRGHQELPAWRRSSVKSRRERTRPSYTVLVHEATKFEITLMLDLGALAIAAACFAFAFGLLYVLGRV